MDKKRIFHIGIGIVIALLLWFLYYKIKTNSINNKIKQEISKQEQFNKELDSIRILNNYRKHLNIQDGTAIKQIEKNIIKNDNAIDTFNLLQLQKLLSKPRK